VASLRKTLSTRSTKVLAAEGLLEQKSFQFMPEPVDG